MLNKEVYTRTNKEAACDSYGRFIIVIKTQYQQQSKKKEVVATINSWVFLVSGNKCLNSLSLLPSKSLTGNNFNSEVLLTIE